MIMKRYFTILIALVLAIGFATTVHSQAGTTNGQANENYNYQLLNMLGTAQSDSVTWSNATKKTRPDTLIAVRADTSTTVLKPSGSSSLGLQLIHTERPVSSHSSTAFTCSLHVQISQDGTNFADVTPVFALGTTSFSANVSKFVQVYDVHVDSMYQNRTTLSTAKYLRFKIKKSAGSDSVFVKALVYNLVYPPRPGGP